MLYQYPIIRPLGVLIQSPSLKKRVGEILLDKFPLCSPPFSKGESIARGLEYLGDFYERTYPLDESNRLLDWENPTFNG
jgi:hypothetical protein